MAFGFDHALMNGLTHFAAGIAWASFFPAAVSAGASGNPGYFVLAAAAGLLPDILASGFRRPLCSVDVEVVLDPGAPDPAIVAQALASAMEDAAARSRPVGVRIHPIRVGPACRRTCEILYDVSGRSVSVRISQPEESPDPAPDAADQWDEPATCGVTAPIRLDFRARAIVDGPGDTIFIMEPGADGSVTPRFLPWRRGWSHSLVTAALLALAVSAAAGWTAGLIAGGAFALHTLMDQSGYTGCQLLAPLSWRRFPGLQWSGPRPDAASHVVALLCVLAIFWNLYTAAGLCYSPLRVFRGLAAAATIPLLAAAALRRFADGDQP
jgi:membrane-bound metal-dependent hydrolase YbcI (DUF457 family)